MMMTGLIWPGWPMLPVLVLTAGFLTLVSFVLPVAPGSQEDARKKGKNACP